MALSNWDTLALNVKGESVEGSFTSPLGVRVEFYKNWLYIHDKKAWEDGGQFVEDTVMEIQSGCLIYKDINILAIRGPQLGCFAIVWSRDYKKDELHGIVGCGVSGFDEKGEFVGVTPETLKWWISKLSAQEEVEHRWSETVMEADGSWTETRHKEKALEHVLDIPDEFRALDWTKALRFNQGDAFFAEHMGFKVPVTAPGQVEPTVLEQILKAE